MADEVEDEMRSADENDESADSDDTTNNDADAVKSSSPTERNNVADIDSEQFAAARDQFNEGDDEVNERYEDQRDDVDDDPPQAVVSSKAAGVSATTKDTNDDQHPAEDAVEDDHAGGDMKITQPINSFRDSEDDSQRKIFVGGLSWETTNNDVKQYFSKYGTVVDCTLKTDPNTGKSRGFGFVLFEESSSVEKVFAEPSHMLNGRKIDPKKAMARGGRDPVRKVFVGGLPPDFPESDIREYFSKYGKIIEIEQPFDKVKNQRRAFIFITYESEEIVEQVIANSKQTVGGREVDVRKATPKSDQDRTNRGNPGNQRGGMTDRGAAPPPAWGPMPGYAPPPGYADYYNSYYAQYAGYPPGYDYSQYYDYSTYYSQPPVDWSSYGQAAAAAAAAAATAGAYGTAPTYAAPGYTAPPGYPPPPPTFPGGYDYSSWYGTDPSGASQAGKAKGRGAGAVPYHPYSR